MQFKMVTYAFVLNMEKSTVFGLVTMKTPIMTYLHPLQNVEYALLPWVLEVLYA